MVCTGETPPSPISTLLHSYHQEITTHTNKHDDIHEAATFKPNDDGQFVGCVDVSLWAVLIWHETGIAA